MVIIYLSGFKMASLCLDTELEALRKIFCYGAHLFFRYFVPLLKKGASQSFQISVRPWTRSCLQNWPNTVVHWIKVRAVGRPFLGSDEIRKMGWNPLLCCSGFVCRSRIVLKGPIAFKMLLGLWQYNGLQNITLIDISINLDTGFDENQRRFARCTDSSPYHHRLGVLRVADDGRRTGRIFWPNSVILVIVRCLDREQLLICE